MVDFRSRRTTILVSSIVMTCALWVGCAHTPKVDGADSGTDLVTYDAEIADQTLGSIFFKLPWELRGPGKVEAIRWTLTLDGEAEMTGEAAADAPTSGTLLVEGALRTSDEAFAEREDKSALRYNVTAMFTVTTADITEDYEATWHGEIYPPKRPWVGVKPQAGRFGGTTEFTFVLILKNPNSFPVPSDGLDFTILIDELELHKGTVAQGMKLDHGSETEYDIQQQVSGKELPELAGKINGKKQIPYRVESVLRTGGLELANTLTGEIEFPR